MSFIEIMDFLNNGFILLIGTALTKAIFMLFKMHIQTNDNTKEIHNIKKFTGYYERSLEDGFGSSSKSPRGRT